MKENVKKRNWVIVGYPDSMPDNWKDILTETGLPIVVSPLHDKDTNITGEKKKPHYHILMCYSGPTSFNVVSKLSEKLNAPIPKYIDNVRGAVRYFTHKDNPEKYQYDEKEMTFLNGFNIADYVEMTKSELTKLKIEILQIIRENDITEYSTLIYFLADNEMIDQFDLASSSTIFFDAVIRSRRHSKENNIKEKEEALKRLYRTFDIDDKINASTVDKIKELFGDCVVTDMRDDSAE